MPSETIVALAEIHDDNDKTTRSIYSSVRYAEICRLDRWSLSVLFLSVFSCSVVPVAVPPNLFQRCLLAFSPGKTLVYWRGCMQRAFQVV